MSTHAWLQRKTRSQMFLWQMTLGILAAGLAAAVLVHAFHPPEDDPWTQMLNRQTPPRGQVPGVPNYRLDVMSIPHTTPPDVPGTVDPWLAANGDDIGLILQKLSLLNLLAAEDSSYDLEAKVAAAIADESDRAVVVECLRSMRQGWLSADLRKMSEARPTPRWAAQARGAVLSAIGSDAEAAVWYEREGRRPDAVGARRLAVEQHLAAGDYDQLRRLLADPSYANVMASTVRYQIALHEEDWLGVLRYGWPARFDRIDAGYVALGVASGVFWLLFLLHAGEVRSFREVRLWLCVVGVGLGALSIAPTLFVYVWMEHALGFTMSPELREGLTYCLLGIGLNEELCKLLLVLPLVPVLVRRGNALEMLVVCSCVGLGFAAEENIAYFAGSMGGAAAGRFLTANFLHLALTGLAGFALCQLVYRPRERAADFAIVFIGVVVLHGLYDALLMIPALAVDWSLFAVTVFILLAFQYFRELRQYRRWTARTVSLTAVLLGGFATLLALTFNYAAWRHGLVPAADALFLEALGAALIIILYLREINEPLTA